jgi:multidrug resistance efflux pump
VGLICGILLLLGWLIRYPDVLEAPVALSTAQPPIAVPAPTGGRVTALLVRDKQSVERGALLAEIENTARRDHVLRLEAWLASGAVGALPDNLQLGGLQNDFSVFSQHWKDYRYFSDNPATAQRAAALRAQIEQLRQINARLARQTALLREESVLADKERMRQQRLLQDRVISDAEYEKTQSAWLQQQRQIEGAETGLLQNDLQIRQLESQINELERTRSDQRNEKELTLNEDLRRLQSAVAEWKRTYLVYAPVGGSVALSKIRSDQQPIAPGETLLTLVPAAGADASGTPENILGRAALPAAGAGKVREGQRVIIRLDGFPAERYGALEGRVRGLSLLPEVPPQQAPGAGAAAEAAGYLLEIALPPDSLRTTYGKVIPFRPEMSGQARVITEDRRVLERIFDRMSDLLRNR